MKRILPWIIFLGSLVQVFSAPAEVEFTGVIKSIQKESDQVAVLMVALTSTFDVPVRVTGLTEIQDEDDKPMTLSELKVGMTVSVKGLFVQKGILAKEVQVAEKGNDFELKGRIQHVDTANREIKLLGFVVQVPETAEIKTDDGNPLLFSDLQVGQFAEVEGNVSGDRLMATEVKVKVTEEKPARIKFEGVIVAIEGSTLKVLIEAVDAAVVHITPDTQVHGELAVGVLVHVAGTINPDLSIKAHKIIVKEILQLAPHKLKMGVNQKRRVEVILRGTLETDVTLTISSLNPDIAKASVSSVTIPKGKIAGFFEVISGPTAGKTSLQVQLPESLGKHKVTLPVEVDGAHNKEDKELEVKWRPSELKLPTNQEKKVQLLLSKAAPAELKVSVSLKEGSPDLLEFPTEVSFAAGSREALVLIKSRSSTGKAVLRARLPETAGGDADDLKVEVRHP